MKNNEIKEKRELINGGVDEITINYKINKIGYIRIFGEKFVENNKYNCKIIINGNEFEICTHININESLLSNNIFELKLKGINKIKDMSHMFYSKKDKEEIPLSSLQDISKWNTQNVTSMKYMFSGCSSLSSLPDISKWNTQNVTSMRYMFDETKLEIPSKFKEGCVIF